MSEQEAFPGSLPGVIAVGLDWECPRDSYRCAPNKDDGAHPLFLASGYPRAIPGVPREQNLNGISFAVANMTGFVVRARQAYPAVSIAELEALLIERA